MVFTSRKNQVTTGLTRLTLLCGMGMLVSGVWSVSTSHVTHFSGKAHAQQNSASCRRLKAQIAALGRRPRSNARYQRAAAKQRRALNRTAAYARSKGCNRTRFLFFGRPPPPQCGRINARIARMRSNLARLESISRGSNANRQAQRNTLLARYDAQCRQRVAVRQAPGRRGFFEQLFGGGHRGTPVYRDMPIEQTPTGPLDPDADFDQGPSHGPKAVCVRTCDGGFFPVSYSARRRNLADLNDLCEALCPNTQVTLFTYVPGRDIDRAVSIDGEPYSSLANAGKYKTTYNPSCTCKPPGKSWATALRRAEGLLHNKSRRDVIVTIAKSRELSKPKAKKEKKLSKKEQRKQERERAEADTQRKLLEEADKRYARDAEKNKAGIATGEVTRRRVYSLHDGKAREIKGPNGVIRKIRIIAPKL